MSSTETAAADRADVAEVRKWYEHYLRRAPDPTGLATFVHDLEAGEPLAAMHARILGSREYFRLQGATPESYIVGLLRDVRGAEPEESQVRHWLEVLSGYDVRRVEDRVQFAWQFVNAREARRPPSDIDSTSLEWLRDDSRQLAEQARREAPATRDGWRLKRATTDLVAAADDFLEMVSDPPRNREAPHEAFVEVEEALEEVRIALDAVDVDTPRTERALRQLRDGLREVRGAFQAPRDHARLARLARSALESSSEVLETVRAHDEADHRVVLLRRELQAFVARLVRLERLLRSETSTESVVDTLRPLVNDATYLDRRLADSPFAESVAQPWDDAQRSLSEILDRLAD